MTVFGSAHAADDVKKPGPAAQKPAAPAQKSEPAAQKSEAPSQKSERRANPKHEVGKTQNELDTCKREAHGKDGPERANFMTACLK